MQATRRQTRLRLSQCNESKQCAIQQVARLAPPRITPRLRQTHDLRPANAAAHWWEKPQKMSSVPNHDVTVRRCQTRRGRSHAAVLGDVPQQIPARLPCRRIRADGRADMPIFRHLDLSSGNGYSNPTRDVRLSARRQVTAPMACPVTSSNWSWWTFVLSESPATRDTWWFKTDGVLGDRRMRARQRGAVRLQVRQGAAIVQTQRNTCQRCCTRKRRPIGLRVQRGR